MNTENKIEETKEELKGWFDRSENYLEIRIKGINEELSESKIMPSVIVEFKLLDHLYSNTFIYEYLTKNISRYKAKAATNGYNIIILAKEIGKVYPNPSHLMFDDAVYWFANCLTMKWYDKSKTLLDILNEGFSTPMLKRGIDVKIASWFIIEIANRGYDIAHDLTQYNYPESLGVYQRALDHWDTQDLRLLDEIVTELCEFHLSQASYGDESEDAGFNDPFFLQFSDAKYFVYVFEILSWLSIREMKGLANPQDFTHPLMQLELNKLPQTVSPATSDELFDKVIQKLRTQN